MQIYDKERHRRNPERLYQKNLAMRKRNRIFILEYLKVHPCVDCGEMNIIVLEFDHIIGEKERCVSEMIYRNSISNLEKEINKCEVVCANCHKKRTEKRNPTYKTIY